MNAVRNSDRRTYRQIPAIIGYRRIAAQSPRTCPACIALDGKFYRLEEEMEEHPNGRCQLVPVTRDYDPTWTTAREWFEEQPEEVQRMIMGPGRLRAFQEGRITWKDIPQMVLSEHGPGLSTIRVRDIPRQ